MISAQTSVPYNDPIPAEEGVDPIWWITGGLTLLLILFFMGYLVLGKLI